MTLSSITSPALPRRLAVPLVAAVLAALAPAAMAQVKLVDLGVGAVTGMSADGHAACGMTTGSFAVWRWTSADGQQFLGRNPWPKLHTGGGSPAISADGQVVAASILNDAGDTVTQGRWTVAGGWQQLAPPLPADGGAMDLNDSNVFGMSADGLVVTGLYWRPGQGGGSAHASTWTAATGMVGHPTDGASSRMDGANTDGSVTVGWEESPVTGSRRAAVWVHGVRTLLDPDGPDNVGEASRVNAAGTIVVGQSYDAAQGRSVAARWDWDGARWNRTLLGVLPGEKSMATSYALGLSDDGSVIVGFDRKSFLNPNAKGFVWTAAGGMVDATTWLKAQGRDVSKWVSLTQVAAVSPDGRSYAMVAVEKNSPYRTRSLIATVPASARTAP